MKKLLPALLLVILFSNCTPLVSQIEQSEVKRIISTLAADDMMGRQAFTPYADKAAAFIAREYQRAGLKKWKKMKSYLQTFPVYQFTVSDLNISADGQRSTKAFAVTTEEEVDWTQNSAVKTAWIGEKDNFREAFGQYRQAGEKAVIWVHPSHEQIFKRYAAYYGQGNRTMDIEQPNTVVCAIAEEMPESFSVQMKASVEINELSNVVGYIKGKRKDEYVLFSAHYDHIGIREAVGQDSIANGANDDASGTTAVITLADYFKKKGKPERSLLFVAFTAEEIGGYGSRYFSEQLDPEKIVAMFNIEMIGKPATDGPNSAWITGFDKSDFGQILQRAVAGTPYKFYADPYPQQNLFYRSDNATLARLGVPAHSISTTPIDVDQDYHQVTDEVSTLDLEHLTNTIRAIAAGAGLIISGQATPSRVDPANVN